MVPSQTRFPLIYSGLLAAAPSVVMRFAALPTRFSLLPAAPPLPGYASRLLGRTMRALAGAKNMVVTSRLKRSLGLRARKTRPMVGARPMTSAEIMRRQMGVSEETNGRVRKTLVCCFVGPQVSIHFVIQKII